MAERFKLISRPELKRKRIKTISYNYRDGWYVDVVIYEGGYMEAWLCRGNFGWRTFITCTTILNGLFLDAVMEHIDDAIISYIDEMEEEDYKTLGAYDFRMYEGYMKAKKKYNRSDK